MNTQNTNQKEIKKGDYVMVWDGSSQWVKRKVIGLEIKWNGEICYIVNFKYGSRTTTGIVYKNEIKPIN